MMNEVSPIIFGIAIPMLFFAVICAVFPFGSDEGMIAFLLSLPVAILIGLVCVALTNKKK